MLSKLKHFYHKSLFAPQVTQRDILPQSSRQIFSITFCGYLLVFFISQRKNTFFRCETAQWL